MVELLGDSPQLEARDWRFAVGRVRLTPSLFVGNARGGRTAAILASLTSTCRRHGGDPQLYLTQLLRNLPSVRLSDLSD